MDYMIGYNTAYNDLENYYEKIIKKLKQEIARLKEENNNKETLHMLIYHT